MQGLWLQGRIELSSNALEGTLPDSWSNFSQARTYPQAYFCIVIIDIQNTEAAMGMHIAIPRYAYDQCK